MRCPDSSCRNNSRDPLLPSAVLQRDFPLASTCKVPELESRIKQEPRALGQESNCLQLLLFNSGGSPTGPSLSFLFHYCCSLLLPRLVSPLGPCFKAALPSNSSAAPPWGWPKPFGSFGSTSSFRRQMAGDRGSPGLRPQNKAELHLLLILLYFICINKLEGVAKQELFKSKQTKL